MLYRSLLKIIVISFALLASTNLYALTCKSIEIKPTLLQTDIPFSKGRMFRIYKDDPETVSYIFGTMHVSNPEVTTLPDNIEQAFRKSGTLVIETVLDPKSLATQFMLMMGQDSNTLSSQVGDEIADKTVALLKEHNIPEAAGYRMHAWAAYITLSTPVSDSELPLDFQLMNRAQESGKKLFALETIEEQLSVIQKLEQFDLKSLLETAICNHDEAQRTQQKMIQDYLAGDLKKLMGYLYFENMSTAEFKVANYFVKELINARNKRMSERVKSTIINGDAFIAIGALHLPGENGLLNILNDEGFTIEVVK